MASILFDLKSQRRELQDRLKDFDNLEKNLYPEISKIVEDLGYDCAASLLLNDETHCYDTFRIGAHNGTTGKIGAVVDVKFASATQTGDYKVMRMTPDGKTIIEHEMCGRPDLMDIIESMLARSINGESEAKQREVIPHYGMVNPEGYELLADMLIKQGWTVDFENRFEELLIAQKGDAIYTIQFDDSDESDYGPDKPWNLYDGTDGEHIDGFKTKEELVACITNKRPGSERPPLTARKVRPLHGQLPS